MQSEPSLDNLDGPLLMWDMRLCLKTDPMPREKPTIQFIYPEQPENQRKYWLIVEPGRDVDVCSVDPGNDIDLYISVDLRTMTEVWMGLKSVHAATDSGAMKLVDNRALEQRMQQWLGLSPFASIERSVP